MSKLLEIHVCLAGLDFYVRDGELQIIDTHRLLDPQNTPGPMGVSEILDGKDVYDKLRFLLQGVKITLAQEASDGS